MDNQEVAKHRKKKNNSSRSDKKSSHKHDYHYCITVHSYNWTDKNYAHRRKYCVLCGKINFHRNIMDSFNDYREDETLTSEESALREKYPDLPVFHIKNFLSDYVDLSEIQE